MVLRKSVLICCLILYSYVLNAQVNWYTIEEAFEAQKKDPRPILIDAYTVWCGPCILLDRNTFSNKDVIEYINTYFYAVKFNAEGDEVVNFQGKTFDNPNYNHKRSKTRNSTHSLTQYLGVSGYPTIVFFDEKGNYITPITGYFTPTQIEIYLKLVNQKDYLNFNSREDFTIYIKEFEYQFKS